MKTIQLWMLALVLMISSSTALTSCSKDDTLVPPSPAQPVILTGEAAVAWTKDHLDSLVNVYLASCGNLLDPDMTRDLLSCIGYTRLNVFDYREAGWVIDSVVLVRLMDRAAEANNKTILFTMGMYGCGKTTSINNNHNNGGKRVTNEEAKQWDYTMTEDLQQKLYAIKQSYIDSGRLNAEQIAALQ